jgi:hypothetical protein
MTNYRALNFTFGPFRNDIDPYAFLNELHSSKEKKENIKKIDTSLINEEFISLMESNDLKINHVESFYKPKSTINSNAHIDRLGGSISKINWIFAGKDSTMNWLELLPGEKIIQKMTEIGTVYLGANNKNCTIIDSCKLQSPSLVQVGILHNVTNPTEDRFCVSVCFIDNKTNKRVPFETATTLLKQYLL